MVIFLSNGYKTRRKVNTLRFQSFCFNGLETVTTDYSQPRSSYCNRSINLTNWKSNLKTRKSAYRLCYEQKWRKFNPETLSYMVGKQFYTVRCNRLLKEKFACLNVIMKELFIEATE